METDNAKKNPLDYQENYTPWEIQDSKKIAEMNQERADAAAKWWEFVFKYSGDGFRVDN